MNDKLIKLANEVLEHNGNVGYCDCNNIHCSDCFLSMENSSDGEACSSRNDIYNYILTQLYLKEQKQTHFPTLSITIGDVVRYETILNGGYGKVMAISNITAHIDENEQGVRYHITDLEDKTILPKMIRLEEIKEIYKLQK